MKIKEAKQLGVRCVPASTIKHGDCVWRESPFADIDGDINEFSWVRMIGKDQEYLIIVLQQFVPDMGAICWLMRPDDLVWCLPKAEQRRCRDQSLDNVRD